MADRYFAVGDIHGCIDDLESAIALIKKLEPNGCKVIFLGDYIDRGPDSLGCIDTVRRFKLDDNGYDVVLLMGNHELMFVEASEDKYQYYDPQGTCVISESGEEFWVDWMRTLEPFHIVEENVFAHANYDPDRCSDINSCVWPRYKLGQDYYGGLYLTHGHTPVTTGPEGAFNRVNLDTGCVFGGPLTIGEYAYGIRGILKIHQITKKDVDNSKP